MREKDLAARDAPYHPSPTLDPRSRAPPWHLWLVPFAEYGEDAQDRMVKLYGYGSTWRERGHV